MKSLHPQQKRIFLYLVFGGLTTAINVIGYYAFAKGLQLPLFLSNGLAWILSVLFAYKTNKVYVFECPGGSPVHIVKEMGAFFASRFFSGFMDMLLMYTGIVFLNLNDLFVKVMTNVVIIVLNYVLSSRYVFKKEKEAGSIE